MPNRTRQGIATILIALATILGAPESSWAADMAELLRKLDLSNYPRAAKPPEFTGRTADGRTVSLASLQGKAVILNFWATWCKECLDEMPAFEQLHRKFAGQGLTVLAINAREGTSAIQKYGKKLNLTFPLILDSKGEINSLYGVVGLPTTFLIGRDGQAVARGVGPRDWASAPARTIIQALLAETAATNKDQ
jgi:cytochrome c biogenesis protein CcmG, thiol:disulfide interchange protein DsbE